MWASNLLPDVVDMAPELGYEFMKNGMFADLNPYMAKERGLKWEQLFPAAVNGVTDGSGGGKRWRLPGSIWEVGTGFNVDAFEAALMQVPTKCSVKLMQGDTGVRRS